MSSTDSPNRFAVEHTSDKVKKMKPKSLYFKSALCGLLTVAVGVSSIYCITNYKSSPEMMNRSLAMAFTDSASNPDYLKLIENVTEPTETVTEAPTEATEAETKGTKEKEKETEKETDAKAETEPATDPQAEKTTEAKTETATAPENTEYVQFGTSIDFSSQETYTEATVPETTPLTQEEIEQRDKSYQQQLDSGYVFAIDNPDSNYSPTPVKLSDKDKELVYKIVMREIGGYGYDASTLVAQAIRDTMNLEGYKTVSEVVNNYGYQGSTNYTPTQEVIDAVDFIFDDNGSAVQHRVLFFYATWVQSNWHESQNFVYQYKCVRFFDRTY